MGYGLYALVGAIVGGGLVWLIYDIKAKRIIEDLRKRLGTAETENLRIGPLEQQIAQARADNEALQGLIGELKEDVAQKAETITALNLQLVEQANAAKDKLSMLNKVQGRFCQALASLSETALNCDNDEFVRVMEVNVTSFEKTLLDDFGKWQSRDKTITREVCDLAYSEQAETPLFAQDVAMEGLIASGGNAAVKENGGVDQSPEWDASSETRVFAQDETFQADEAAVGEKPPSTGQGRDVEVIEEGLAAGERDAAEDHEAGLREDERVVQRMELVAENEEAATADAEPVEAAQDREPHIEPVLGGWGGDDNQESGEGLNETAIENQTNAAVADLEREIEEGLALDFEDSDDDDDLKLDFGTSRPQDMNEEAEAEDAGEILLADDDMLRGPDTTLSLKFPICEIPALDNGAERAREEAEEDARKKKLSRESEEERREAV